MSIVSIAMQERVHSQLRSASFFRFYELFHGQQAHLGFVTVTDTQQVALQGVQLRNSLWTTWEVERRRLPPPPLPPHWMQHRSAGAITASTISSSV